VESCPTQALHWGDLDDPNSDVSKFIAAHPGEIEDYMPEEGADYVVRYYKLPKPFITGEVVLADKANECPEGVKVTLGGAGSAETATDFLGDFQFKYLEKGGKYTVTVSYPGYKDYQTEVTLDKAKDLGVITLAK